jgi:hypothetical protein
MVALTNALFLAGNEEERIGFAKQLLVNEEVLRAWCLLMADRA